MEKPDSDCRGFGYTVAQLHSSFKGVVPGSILESAMLAWLGSDVMGPSTVDMSTHTLTGYSSGPFWLKWCSLPLGYPPRSRLAILNGKCQWMEL